MHLEPPVAKKKPQLLEAHGHQRTDNYYWLNQREDPAVKAWLEAENEYTHKIMASSQALREQLFAEMKSRIKDEEQSLPYKKDNYFYYYTYQQGQEYPIHWRKYGNLEAQPQLVLNENTESDGHIYFQTGEIKIAPDEQTLAWSSDTVGRRIYQIAFRKLDGTPAPEEIINNTSGNFVWAADSQTIFYTRQDPQTLRVYQVLRHRLGSKPDTDVLVYQEDDELYSVELSLSRSEEYIFISCHSTLTSEVFLLPAHQPETQPVSFLTREKEHEYHIDHAGGTFFIKSNKNAPNFCLYRAPEGQHHNSQTWQLITEHREDIFLEEFEVFEKYLLIEERHEGLISIRVCPDWETSHSFYIPMDEQAYGAGLSINAEYQSEVVRYHYTSLTTPVTIYDFNMSSRTRQLMKQQEIPGSFSPEQYQSERLYATARDGARVPVSLVYKKGITLTKAPLLLYGYGSYGISMDAYFSQTRLSLLDRGFIFAIAHIRGGQEMGRQWYEQGKFFQKKNTFYDFIDCAEFLKASGYGDPECFFARGGSAGGLLVGAVMNMRPDLFKGITALVPFVDVVTTMLDDSIPLTTGEYEEWGNPNQQDYYHYMLSYSPYDNVAALPYPHLLVTAGFHDSQVQYWEPAKWVAKLREFRTNNNLILLYTNMDAGHGGASGRYAPLSEIALEYAFILKVAALENDLRNNL